ncbi:transmembrane protein [Achlya hypogyna]|uniref:Transmembrane protein n=1 Tax=Achlya hypogyna TaxID=1202772 RepID=A0A1V9YE38_ACHHY|nr:transmembrane protein [Achlya hypogyna]
MTTNICTSAAFASAPVIQIGQTPMTIKTLVQSPYVCFQLTIADASTKWLSLSVAATPKMVNQPVENVVVYDVTTPPAMLFTMYGYGHQDTRLNSDQSPINVTSSSFVNGVAEFTFQRRLAAIDPTDVAIDPNGVTILTWAYDTKSFPSTHKACGALELILNSANNSAPGLNTLNTAAIAAGLLGVMLLLGIAATHFGRFRLINHTTLCAPPKSDKGLSFLVQMVADLKVGEAIIVLIFILALVGAALYLQKPNPIVNYSLFAFISGHLALLCLMFSLIPIARGPHWRFLFGSSHERVLKFHLASSRLFVVFSIIHFVLYLPFTSPSSTQLYGQTAVVPLPGLAGLILAISLGTMGYEPIRRKYYATFYMHHRIVSLLVFLFVLLHSAVIRYAMIVPLILYGLSGIVRVRAFCNRYDAPVASTGNKTVTIVLPSTSQTKHWAATMPPSAFFYVQVPGISAIEWHPLTAVATPDGASIGFVLKAMTPGRFADEVVADVLRRTGSGRATMPVVVGGPYGYASVNILEYQAVIFVAGGVGITPMLSLVNQFRNKQGKGGSAFHLYWVVRDVNDLLMAEALMYPLPDTLRHRFFVTAAAEEGKVLTTGGGSQSFYPRRPKWPELINNVAFVGKSACVLACGPDALIREVQGLARKCGFDFHKEEFAF